MMRKISRTPFYRTVTEVQSVQVRRKGVRCNNNNNSLQKCFRCSSEVLEEHSMSSHHHKMRLQVNYLMLLHLWTELLIWKSVKDWTSLLPSKSNKNNSKYRCRWTLGHKVVIRHKPHRLQWLVSVFQTVILERLPKWQRAAWSQRLLSIN